MLTTMMIGVVGVHWTLLQRFLGRVGVRLGFFLASTFRLLRRGRDVVSKQTMPSERRSARRASACHRACSFVGDKLASGTLRTTLRCRRVSEWRWRLCGARHTGRLARHVRFVLGGEHVRFDWKGEEPPSNMHDGHAAAAPFALKLDWDTMFRTVFFFTGKHFNLPDQPPQACHA